MATDITINGTSIDYRDFEIEVVLSPEGVAPSATVTAQARESVSANDDLVITIDGTTAFDGRTTSGGTKSELGGLQIQVQHAAVDLFNESVTFTETSPTDQSVLSTALSNANSGADFTLDYSGTATSLNNDYSVENRTVKRVFRDMMDRTSRVWWVEPGGSTIHVEPVGDRGLWQSIDTQTDKATLSQFDSGTIDSVRNDVTVIGTGDVKVSGSASDSTSISNYGRQSETVNVSYVTAQTEASAMASELLITDPLAEGELLVGQNVGDVVSPRVNQTVDVTDSPKDVSETGLVIESQTIKQGQATLAVGEGSGVSLENINRQSKSQSDVTEPGSVVNGDRIADDSVDTNQLVDTAVIESKLADAAVATAKLQNNAVINGKLDDLSVSETKIQDDSIATPKLQASAVTANEIEADTITAAEIAAGTITATEILADTLTADEIASDTITAIEIATDTLTANEIDTLDLDTGELSIGTSTGAASLSFTSLSSGDVLVAEPSGFVRLGSSITALDDVRTELLSPPGDNQGTVGESFEAFSDIYGYNLIALTVVDTPTLQVDLIEPNGDEVEFDFPSGDSDLLLNDGNGRTNIYPDTDDSGRVGRVFSAFHEMWAYDYFDAATETSINDGGDVLAGLAEGHGPPDHCAKCDDDGNVQGYSLNGMARSAWDVIREQQRVIEDKQKQIDDLESRIEALENA